MGLFKKSDDDYQNSSLDDLRKMVMSSKMPLPVEQTAVRELDIISKINPSTAEYSIGLTYIDYLLSLPWNKRTDDILDLERAAKILDERHYGLPKVKERILEHLAVKILVIGRKPRLLIVDDERIALENLEPVMKKEGYEVHTAGSGGDALEKLDALEFDVVITDLKMNNVTGIDVLTRAKHIYRDTQVIMITGYASVDSAVESMKKGAFHYISKPFKLDEVRGTVREALNSRSASRSAKGSVMCFAGPPGTGKTSLGKAVADTLGRKFVRISLGGMKDESEIRGHRRTYAGAMPGRIIDEIRRAGVLNPLIMLDELDKIGQDFTGDSASALLEVLDPEQNHSFSDNYLDVPFDLSGVMFIATANIAENIQEALRDRMEVITFSGYTEDEKVRIADQYIIPKQIQAKGLSERPPRFTEDAIMKIIHEHTREAGIRNLEREIAAICRKLAAEHVAGRESPPDKTVTPQTIERYLGPRKYYYEVADEKNRTGVTTGLVWTETGGAIIFVESAVMKGSGELMITGSLGSVMRESAQTALSFVRSNAASFQVNEDIFASRDIHIHVPAGAIPKDGPSAGATIAMSLLSLLTGRPARRDTAITGELTLSGRLLPVAGIREKLLAARQAGVRTVIMPGKNRIDIGILPKDMLKGLEIHYADDLEEILDLVLL